MRLATILLAWAALAQEPSFRHHFLLEALPPADPPADGIGSPMLADLDNDGDLDFAVLIRNRKLYWFENRGPAGWERRAAGESPLVQLGSAVLDVDRDGWTDLVIGGSWFRNNGKGAGFTRFTYDSRIRTEIHDLTLADMNGDKRLDLVALGDREGLFWYAIPDAPARDSDWPRTLITDAVLDGKDDIHGGVAPRGAGDLDGDGDADIVLPDRWLENAGRGEKWVRHELPFGKRGPWGLSVRSWIIDLDRDGDADIVITDCDQAGSRAGWLENKDGEFTFHAFPLTAPGVRGSFHSLAVGDFDGDGDPDIATADQEDTKILPSGAPPRFYLFVNQGGGRFEERVILDAKLGGHDIAAGDIDGDGDLDIASKVWRRWPENGNQGRPHVDWLENTTKASARP